MGGDSISGELGDDASRAAIGKDIRQDNRSNQTPINISNTVGGRQPPTRPQRSAALEDRLDRIELYMYGDGIVSPGVLRQLAELIQQNSDIKKQNQNIMFWMYALTALLTLMVVLAALNLTL